MSPLAFLAEARRRRVAAFFGAVLELRPRVRGRVVADFVRADALALGQRVTVHAAHGSVTANVFAVCTDPLSGRVRLALEGGEQFSLAPTCRVLAWRPR